MLIQQKLQKLIGWGCCFFLLTGFFSHSSGIDPFPTEAVIPSEISDAGLQGAWIMSEKNGQSMDELGIQMVKLLSGGHFMFAFFNEKDKKFFSAGGGKYTFENGIYKEHITFHTINPDLIGTTLSFKCELKDGKWHHTGRINDHDLNEVFVKADDNFTVLEGAWEMESFMNTSGKMEHFTQGSAKKVKLLAGNRFQWSYYDPQGGFFIETGGGTYSYENGVYTEQIEYYSNDSSPLVGQDQKFVCILKEGQWHHHEVSATRGNDPYISEVWHRAE